MILYLMYFIICESLVIPEIPNQMLLRMHILNSCTKQITLGNIFLAVLYGTAQAQRRTHARVSICSR